IFARPPYGYHRCSLSLTNNVAAIKNGLSNSVNSYIQKCSNKYPAANGFLAYQKGCGAILCIDRTLLSQLSQCAWKVLSHYLTQGVSLDNPKPRAIIAVQTFGDLLNFNPHLHIIATDGGFMVGTEPDASSLNRLGSI
ncbi:MAG: transposase, partial [Syntrophomonadaceae bacterium]|nr:transposase [Syntrophomonadaceae bacterium]